MSNLSDELAIYLPIDRRHALGFDKPLNHSSRGAALFADVTGFTRMTLTLIEELGNRRGAEELSSLLNRIYTTLITEVHQYHGSVISFSGDAITCWFDDGPSPDAGLRAVMCAQEMQAGMAAFKDIQLPSLAAPISVEIKVLVTSGRVRRFEVGDPDIHLIDVIAGPPIDRINDASDLMKSGEVLVDRETWSKMATPAPLKGWRNNGEGADFAVLKEIDAPIAPSPWPVISEGGVTEEKLRTWLLPSVYERLQSGQGPFLAEFRKVTSLMLMFRGPDIDDPAAPDKFSRFIGWVQKVLLHYDGSLLDFNLGDKGAYISAAFGAPITHENDSSHGLSAALALLKPPPELEDVSEIKIGLSRGWMRVGAYGSSSRGTYGIHGNEINVAARLMQRASPGQILVTEYIVDAVPEGYTFASIGSVEVKNINKPIAVFSLVNQKTAIETRKSKAGPSPMVGRREEQERLSQLFAEFKETGSGKTTLVLGEAGTGKTMLAADFLAHAEDKGIPVLSSGAEAIERRTPYYPWRAVFSAIAGIKAQDDASAAQEKVLNQYGDDPQWVERLALLNSILPVEFPETPVTSQMAPEVRANNTIELLMRMLHRYTAGRPAVLLLDDIHWLDSASWRLVEAIQSEQPALFMLLLGRPERDSDVAEFNRLQASPQVEILPLGPISGQDSAALISQTLQCPDPSKNVVRFLEERTQGNPFFLIELALALQEAGVIDIQNGTCELTPLATDIQSLDIPDTIHGVVTSRIDRLAPAYQLVLKVASVIGRIFEFQSLHDIFPVQPERTHLPNYLQLLDEREITPMESPPPDLKYGFKQIITQEVVYNQLLFNQRKDLHEAMAEWLEQTHTDDLSANYPLMAHHWKHAEYHAKAIHYLERAGAQALQDFANREAVDFFSQAIELSDRLEADQPTLRRARWEMGLGDAYYGLGEMKNSQHHYRAAAALLDEPEPGSSLSLGARILREMLRQELYRRRGPRPVKSSAEREEAQIYASQIYEKLSKTYYYSGEQIHGLHAVFRSVNLADSSAESDLLAEQRSRGYASVAAGYQGALRLRSMGEYYFKQSREIAEDSGNAGALGWSLQVRALIDGVVNGSWESALETNERALEIYADLRDNRGWEETMHSQIYVRGYQGRLDLKLALAQELYEFASRQNDIQYQIYGLCHQTTALMLQGELDQALACLQEIEPLLSNHQFAADHLFAQGVAGLVNFHAGRWDQAQQYAEEAAGLIEDVPIGIIALDGYAGVAEVFLGLLEYQETVSSQEVKGMHKSTEQALGALQKTSRQYEPVRKSQILRLQGRQAWVKGNPRKAFRLWNKSLDIAERLGLILDQAHAHLVIGVRSEPDHSEKIVHLHTAAELFEELGSRLYLNYAEEALSEAEVKTES